MGGLYWRSVEKGRYAMTVLFVNACLRGAESRTLTLCREYLQGIEGVKEVDLAAR